MLFSRSRDDECWNLRWFCWWIRAITSCIWFSVCHLSWALKGMLLYIYIQTNVYNIWLCFIWVVWVVRFHLHRTNSTPSSLPVLQSVSVSRRLPCTVSTSIWRHSLSFSPFITCRDTCTSAKSIQGFNISYLCVAVSWFSGLSVLSSDVIRLLEACSFSVLLYIYTLRTFSWDNFFYSDLKLQMFAWSNYLSWPGRNFGFKFSA